MTDNERRILLRGMSIASGLLISSQCTHRGVISTYQKALSDAWDIDENDAVHREEFKQLVEELNGPRRPVIPMRSNQAALTNRLKAISQKATKEVNKSLVVTTQNARADLERRRSA